MARPPARLRRGAAALLLSLAAGLLPTGSRAVEEAELKAAFVLRLAGFVDWPEKAFAGPASPLVVQVAGAPGLAAELERMAASQRIHGRAVEVRRGSAPGPGAHVVFLGSGAAASVPGIVRDTAALPVLTMSDLPGFARRGGIFELVRDGARIRFEVNEAHARRAGLRVSAQVLRLASAVHPEEG